MSKTEHEPFCANADCKFHSGSEYADFTHEAEFIGWNGVCVKCVLVDGVEI